MKYLRFNPPAEWSSGKYNQHFYGLANLLLTLRSYLDLDSKLKMCEIGSYKGESTMMFASSGLFDKIHCIDPLSGDEEFNSFINKNWDNVEDEFNTNTRFFNNIKLHKDFSYNISEIFEDKFFDFTYIDASHEYLDVKKDLELFIPKTKCIIAGHDYQPEWPGVIKAVNEELGKPDGVFDDHSWLKIL